MRNFGPDSIITVKYSPPNLPLLPTPFFLHPPSPMPNYSPSLYMLFLSVCLFVSNKRRNGWTSHQAQILCETMIQGWFTDAQNYKNLCSKVFDFWNISKMRKNVLLNPRTKEDLRKLNILNPDRLIWISTVETFNFILIRSRWISLFILHVIKYDWLQIQKRRYID